MKFLKRKGHEVIVGTFDKTDWDLVSRNYGEKIEPNKSIFLFPRRIPIFGIYQRTLLGSIAKRLSKFCDITINTHSDHLFCKTDLVYIHGVPDDVYLLKNGMPLWKKLYYMPHLALTKERRWNSSFNPKIIPKDTRFISNSIYTSNKFKFKYGHESEVIYPPVEVAKYRELLKNGERDNLVITVARAGSEKNLMSIPNIVEKTSPDITFVLITSVNSKANRFVLNLLMKQEERLNGRFKIYLDMNQKAKMNLMSYAKVFFQPAIFEHFGIALAEGIASGLHPVVANNGGHIEVVNGIKDSKFNTPWEAAQLIEKAVYTWSFKEAKVRSERMNAFDEEIFYKKMLRTIELKVK